MSDFEILKYYQRLLVEILEERKKINGAAQPKQDFNVRG